MHRPVLALFRTHRARWAWLALLALCAQLWAVQASHGHQLKRLSLPPSLLVLCSSTGLVSGPSGEPSPGEPAGSAAPHCPFCLLAHELPWAADVTLAVATPALGPLPTSRTRLQAPPAQRAHERPPARAPPFLA